MYGSTAIFIWHPSISPCIHTFTGAIASCVLLRFKGSVISELGGSSKCGWSSTYFCWAGVSVFVGSARMRRINFAAAVSLLEDMAPPFHALNLVSAENVFVLASVSNRFCRHWLMHLCTAAAVKDSWFRSSIESEEVATPPPSSNSPFCSSFRCVMGGTVLRFWSLWIMLLIEMVVAVSILLPGGGSSSHRPCYPWQTDEFVSALW